MGDPIALRLCLERLLPPRRERAVKFALPPIESPADIAAAMKAVAAALAEGRRLKRVENDCAGPGEASGQAGVWPGRHYNV